VSDSPRGQNGSTKAKVGPRHPAWGEWQLKHLEAVLLSRQRAAAAVTAAPITVAVLSAAAASAVLDEQRASGRVERGNHRAEQVVLALRLALKQLHAANPADVAAAAMATACRFLPALRLLVRIAGSGDAHAVRLSVAQHGLVALTGRRRRWDGWAP
jgi:hypothetical protein